MEGHYNDELMHGIYKRMIMDMFCLPMLNLLIIFKCHFINGILLNDYMLCKVTSSKSQFQKHIRLQK